jgi:hypothetical protein
VDSRSLDGSFVRSFVQHHHVTITITITIIIISICAFIPSCHTQSTVAAYLESARALDLL